MTINSWIASIGGGSLLLLLGALAIVLVINADLRASIAADDAAKALLLSENKQWAEKVAANNAALAKIKNAAAVKTVTIEKAQRTTAALAKKLQEQAAAIASFKFAGDDCAQILALHHAYMEQWK